MDRRRSLLLGLGVGLGCLLGSAGCTGPEKFKEAKKPAQAKTTPTLASTPVASKKSGKKGKETARRQPKPETCVAFGDFRLREALQPERSEVQRNTGLDQARRAYQQALSIDPKCVPAHRGLGRVYTSLGEHEKANACYETLLKLNPRDAGAWMDLGMSQSRLKDFNRAVQSMRQAVEIDPENRQFMRLYGLCLARAGQMAEALACLRQVDGEARAHFNLGRMYMHLGQEEQARQHLSYAVQTDPNLTEARDILAALNNTAPAGTIVPVNHQTPHQ